MIRAQPGDWSSRLNAHRIQNVVQRGPVRWAQGARGGGSAGPGAMTFYDALPINLVLSKRACEMSHDIYLF